MFNKKELSYLVNFGAHPILKIAVEKAITELFQGRNMECYEDTISITVDYKKATSEGNKYKIFSHGGGCYDIHLLMNQEEARPRSYIWNMEFKSNYEMLSILIKLIKKVGFTVYYHDNSYLGFPALQIIIPGMSELTSNNYNEFKFNEICEQAKKMYFNINVSKKENIRSLIRIIDNNSIGEKFSLSDLIKLPLEKSNDLENITKNILLIILYAAVYDYNKAYEYSVKYLKELAQMKDIERDIIQYYKIISFILNCKRDKIPDDEISDILSNYVENNVIEECLNDLKEENLFLYLPTINCPKCNECLIENQCKFKNEKKIYDIIIKQYKVCS